MSLTPAERMDLESNPHHLAGEIARYTAIRAEAESKLRAVVDEATANEYLKRAEVLQREAEGVLERAQETVQKMVIDADAEATKLRELAQFETSKLRKDTDEELDRQRSVVAERFKDLEEREQALESQRRELNGLESEAKESLEKSIAERQHYGAALTEVNRKAEALERLVREMGEVLGGGRTTS